MNGQQVYEEVLSITNNQGIANPDDSELSPHASQSGLLPTRQLTSVGGNVNRYSCHRNSVMVPQKIKNRTIV